jgi:hypothetical protein
MNIRAAAPTPYLPISFSQTNTPLSSLSVSYKLYFESSDILFSILFSIPAALSSSSWNPSLKAYLTMARLK